MSTFCSLADAAVTRVRVQLFIRLYRTHGRRFSVWVCASIRMQQPAFQMVCSLPVPSFCVFSLCRAWKVVYLCTEGSKEIPLHRSLLFVMIREMNAGLESMTWSKFVSACMRAACTWMVRLCLVFAPFYLATVFCRQCVRARRHARWTWSCVQFMRTIRPHRTKMASCQTDAHGSKLSCSSHVKWYSVAGSLRVVLKLFLADSNLFSNHIVRTLLFLQIQCHHRPRKYGTR